MALKSRTWACPDCEGQFTTLTDDREGPPRFCQCCGNDMSADPEVIPYFSRVGKSANQTLDKTYRAMESASIARAEEAASMMNVPVSEMSHIKMTNMRDNVREGDTSYIAPPSQEQAIMRNGVAPASSADVAALRGGAALGSPPPATGLRPPSPGSQMLDKLRPMHTAQAAAMAKRGEIGRYTG